MAKHARYKELLRLKQGRAERIGIFGGSFDPVHDGHYLCAEALRKSLKLNKVLWLPAPSNPLKHDRQKGFEHRIHALQNFLRPFPHHQETRLHQTSGKIFTIDFLRWLGSVKHPHKLFWLGGADLISEVHHWKDWLNLNRYADWCLYNRPEDDIRACMHPARRQLVKHWVQGRRSSLRSRDLR